jgi:hypothetical protein
LYVSWSTPPNVCIVFASSNNNRIDAFSSDHHNIIIKSENTTVETMRVSWPYTGRYRKTPEVEEEVGPNTEENDTTAPEVELHAEEIALTNEQRSRAKMENKMAGGKLKHEAAKRTRSEGIFQSVDLPKYLKEIWPLQPTSIQQAAREKNEKEKASEGVGMFYFFLGGPKIATIESKLDRQK